VPNGTAAEGRLDRGGVRPPDRRPRALRRCGAQACALGRVAVSVRIHGDLPGRSFVPSDVLAFTAFEAAIGEDSSSAGAGRQMPGPGAVCSKSSGGVRGPTTLGQPCPPIARHCAAARNTVATGDPGKESSSPGKGRTQRRYNRNRL